MNGEDNFLYFENFINGNFCKTDTWIDSYNPCTGKVFAKVANSDETDVISAIAAANNAFIQWSNLPAVKRASYLFKIADKIEANFEEFAKLESQDQGKTYTMASTVDIPRAILNLRTFAATVPHELGSVQAEKGQEVVHYSVKYPVGVAALITPWNLPLYLLTFKLGPALMSGCTVVCKPSEMTTGTTWMLCKMCTEVGLPPGVLNVVCGYGKVVGEALVSNPDVKCISFTGSTTVGKSIATIAAPMMKKLSLELGGKNCAIIFEDANLNQAVPTLLRSCFMNQGEICLCTSRVFLHKNIYKEFMQRFVEEVKKLKTGDSKDKKIFNGALISKEHCTKVKSYISQAIKDGGKILCGETVDKLIIPNDLKEGYYCLPTVIEGLGDTTACMQEEIFGPVACFTSFETEEEVEKRANNVKYGLCASVWSQNNAIIHRMSEKLHVGTVWNNCWLVRSLDMPFGGTKYSGTGREGTKHSLDTYMEEKTICNKF